MTIKPQFEEITVKSTYKTHGFFYYTDHYSNEPDLIYISTVNNRSKTKIKTMTFDGIFKRGEYYLSPQELTMLANMICLAWKNNTVNYSCTIESNKKTITVKTEKAFTKLERNKHMSIIINNVCMAYGFDINDSRRFYKMLAEIINRKSSTLLA